MDYSPIGNKKRTRSPHTTRMRNKIGLLIIRVTISLVLIAGFAGIGAGIGVYIGILNNSPVLDIRMLGPISPRAIGGGDVGFGEGTEMYLSSFIICARTGEVRETLHRGHNREFAPISMMPRHLIYAFVAIEDERFFEHNGIDPRGIVRALYVATIPDRPTEGASTITQQLVKNMLGIDNDIITKLQEQHIAVNFERHLVEEFTLLGYEDPHMAAKYFILQSYLNMINLGRSNYGVQAAANFYFDVCVSELTIAQAATIASITQNPSRFPPDARPRDNWRRTQLVLNNMYHRLGLITTEEFEEAMQARQMTHEFTGEPLYDDDGEPIMIGLVYDTIFRREDGGIRDIVSDFDCFTDALLAQVRDDLMREHDLTLDQANTRIFTQGLRIYSTQDMRVQPIVDRAFLDESLWPGTDVGFTIEVTHNMTVYNTITQQTRTHRDRRDVRSLEEAEAFIEEMKERVLTHADEVVAERTFKLPQPQGAFILIDHYTGHVLAMRGIRGEKQGNRAFNRATEATRSPGSQMKPLVPFAPLFELGLMQPSTVIDDIPFYLPNPGGRGWAPLNHWDSGRVFRGLTTARNAIYASGNVVSARAAADPRLDNHAGVPTMFRFLELMGISTLSPMDGPAIVLGGITRGTKLIELAGAYATIANHGEFNRPVLYTRVLDHEGNILLENPHNPQRVLAATTAYLLTHSMVDTVRIGTGPRVNWTPDSGLRGQIPIAGKTGTSQNNRDLGFVGYTPYFTAAFWIGNDNEQPLHRRTREFHLPMWRTIMQEVHLELDLPARSFTRPAGIVTARVCLDSGHLPTEYCRTDPRGDRTISEVFAAGLVPTHHCRVHQQHTYCTESGMLACENCPYWLVTTRVGLVRPMPIDDIEATVTDRHLEFPLGVRQGLTCAYHVAGGFFAGPSNPWLWDFETGQWVPNPNFNPDTQTQEPADDEDYDALPPGMDFTPAVPEAPGNDIPPEWPGLGAPPAVTNEDDEDSDPFVTTVTIPGLN